jgi:hypothetical protein
VRFAAGALFLLYLSLGFASGARAQAQASGAPADSATPTAPAPSAPPPAQTPAARPAASAESLRVVRIVRADTVRATELAPPRFRDPSRIDFDAQRKRGDVTLEAALEGRRASWIDRLPLAGAPTGTLVEPASGFRFGPGGERPPGEAATDRTWMAAAPYGIGFFDMHTSIVDPGSEGFEVFDWNTLESEVAPRPFRAADELITGPEPHSSLARAMPGHPVPSRRPRSALYYSNGEMGELVTGARFASPALGRGIGASYSRHESDGVPPLAKSVSSRYAGAVGIPGAFGHSFWLDGWLFERTVEDQALQGDVFGIVTAFGRSEAKTKVIALHGRAEGPRGESEWAVRGARAKRTRVEPDGVREGWDFPEWSLAWAGAWRADSTWSLVAAVDAAARRIEYVDATGLSFSTRKDQGRAAFGVRRARSRGLGIGADAAWDVRASDRSLWDVRVSLWSDAGRAAIRLDLESAHQRPTWVDRLTPARTITALQLPDFSKVIRLTRTGDDALEPRRLDGLTARGAWEISRALSVSGSAAARRVADDFGWDLERAETVDSLLVDVTARQRGDGWTSYGSLGFTARAGTAVLRGLGWARRDQAALSPRAGSLPLWGVEGALDLGVTLFKGDLPLILGVEVHVAGKREGPITDVAGATFDGALRADFGSAGAFVEMQNLFDRKYRSALYDVAADQGVLMPERLLHFGIVWYLLD